MKSMRHFSRYLTLAGLLALGSLTTLGGCSKIGETVDCEQMCETLRTCFDGDLSVSRCSDRCEDQTDTTAMRNDLDDCTDCLDQDYSCAEISDECPMCQDLIDELL
jgi:hypothetical protein